MPQMYHSIRVFDNNETVSVVVDDVEVDKPVLQIHALVDKEEFDRIVSNFDAGSQSSPPAAESREIARPLVEERVK